MFKFDIQYKQELKAEIRKVKAADVNIREAMVDWRNDTIQEIKEFLDDDNTWEYPHEHAPGAVGRLGGNQVRSEHGSEHFAFLKFGKPTGTTTVWQVNIENASPDNVGNFILGGVSQPSRPILPLDSTNLLRWRHEKQSEEGMTGMVPESSRSNIPGRSEEFQKEILSIATINMQGTKAYLSALGDQIFSNYMVRTKSSQSGKESLVGEPSFPD